MNDNGVGMSVRDTLLPKVFPKVLGNFDHINHNNTAETMQAAVFLIFYPMIDNDFFVNVKHLTP